MSSLRALTVAAIAILATSLTACGPSDEKPSPTAADASSTEPATEDPTEETSAADAELPDYSLDANSVFEAGKRPQIADQLFGADGWELTSPDDGQGHWGYTETATGCLVDFFQFDLSQASLAAADDQAATLTFMSELWKQPVETFAANPERYTVPATNTVPFGAPFETLSALITYPAGSSISLSRAFQSAATGIMINTKCATADQARITAGVVTAEVGLMAM